MPLPEIHDRLAQTCILFIAILGIWAFVFRLRSRPLDGNWYGAAVLGELLLVAQFLLGCFIYLQLGSGILPRPSLHILYGLVALLVLPTGYTYFSRLEEENVKSLGMALVCIFLWGIIMRGSTVAEFLPNF